MGGVVGTPRGPRIDKFQSGRSHQRRHSSPPRVSLFEISHVWRHSSSPSKVTQVLHALRMCCACSIQLQVAISSQQQSSQGKIYPFFCVWGTFALSAYFSSPCLANHDEAVAKTWLLLECTAAWLQVVNNCFGFVGTAFGAVNTNAGLR